MNATTQKLVSLIRSKKIPITSIVGFSLSFAILGFLVLRSLKSLQTFLASGAQIHFDYLLVSLFSQIASILTITFVWSHILTQLEIRAGYPFDLQVFLVSTLARKLPGVIWHAVGRIFLYERKLKGSATSITLGLVVETASLSLAGFTIMILCTTIGGVHLPGIGFHQHYFLPGIAALLLIFFLETRAIKSIARWIYQNRYHKKVNEISVQPVHALMWLFGHMLTLAFGAGVIYTAIKSINPDITVTYMTLLTIWSITVAISPITIWIPNSYLIGDGILYLAVSSQSTESIAALAILASRLWIILLEILFGGIAAILLGHVELQKIKNKITSVSGTDNWGS